MESIYDPNNQFDFTNISLAHPTGIQGGAYFTKILYNSKPLYINTPQCLTKQGFVKNGKKIYVDLMFNNNDEDFIHWIENLETTCQQLVYDKGDSWFQNKLEMNDIESAFTSPLRVYKSGKYYLVRVNVKMNYSTNFPHVKIYNESETPLTVDDVSPETNIVSIVEVQGIKFTSKNFQIELELKQSMVLNTDAIFDNCLIKTHKQTNPMKSSIIDNLKVVPAISFNAPDSKVIHLDAIDSPDMAFIKPETETEIEIESEIESESKDVSDILDKLSDAILNQEEEKVPEKTLDAVLDKDLDKGLDNIVLVVEPVVASISTIHDSLGIKPEPMEDLAHFDLDELEEFQIQPTLNSLETITLKKPNQVYYEIYKEARKKAKKAKREAIVAFLEAKNIKKTYMLDELDESDEDSDVDLENLSDYSDSDDLEITN